MASEQGNIVPLPRELLDTIISQLDKHDIKTLTSFHLCCRALVPAIRSLLFRSVTLQPLKHFPPSRDVLGTGNPCSKFWNLVTNNPCLGPTVERLVVRGSVDAEVITEPDPWTSLPDIASKLPNLKVVEVRRVQHWDAESQYFFLGIQVAIGQPNVSWVRLSGVNTRSTFQNVISSIFQRRTSLEMLELDKFVFNDVQSHLAFVTDDAHAPTSLQLKRLKTQFNVRGCLYLMQLLTATRSSCLDLTNLRFLSLTVTLRFALGILQQALTATNNRLDELEVRFTGFSQAIDKIQSLPSSSLKRLTFVLSYYAIDEPYFRQQLCLVAEALVHLTHTTGISTINLIVNGPALSNITVGEPDWSPIVDILTQSTRWIHLRVLSVTYIACPCESEDCGLYRRFCDTLLMPFDLLNKKGVLKFRHLDATPTVRSVLYSH